MGDQFGASRLFIARTRCEMFVNELAERCAVARHTVAAWEAGTQTPTAENTAKLASVTGFPVEFFYRPIIEPIAEGAASFRARSRLHARQKSSALASGAMARELAAWIDSRFKLPPVSFPDLSSPEIRKQPTLLAKVVRNEWMLGEKPIPNMIHLLESRGAIVFSLARDVRELDAFSFWADGRPIIFLNTMKSAERSRMDAAHELLHLVCRHERTDKAEERAADEFAGAFLMPTTDVFRRAPRFPDRTKYLLLKREWGVSLAGLIYRLHELKIISDWQYRILFIDMSKRGDLKREPNAIPHREKSTLLAQVFGALEKRGTRPPDVARQLAWPRRHLDEFVFGMGATIVAMEGGRNQSPAPRRKEHLRIVKGKG